jgi:hypothetical protein
MLVTIRIIGLSLVMSIYMMWAFRGIEYDPQESVGALLLFLGGYLILTAVAVPVYQMTKGKSGGDTASFAFRFWLISVTAVTIAWLTFFWQDPAAAGFFRDNIIVGAVILPVLVAAANFAIVQGFTYLAPKRR